MTEVTDSNPEEAGQKLQNEKKKPAAAAITQQPKPDNNAKRNAPSSGQSEQRDTTIGKRPSASDDDTQA